MTWKNRQTMLTGFSLMGAGPSARDVSAENLSRRLQWAPPSDALFTEGVRLMASCDTSQSEVSYITMSQRSSDSLAVERWEVQARKGVLELVVLAALWSGRLYGLELIRRLEGDAQLTVPEGTLYPLLNRMRAEGQVDAEWVEAEAGHPRKYYRFDAGGTPTGRADGAVLAPASPPASTQCCSPCLRSAGNELGARRRARDRELPHAAPDVAARPAGRAGRGHRPRDSQSP
jgi:PadR family transcriptional regulator PadR